MKNNGAIWYGETEMKRIKDIACISRPSANIRIKPAIMLLERYCFLNIQRYIIATSTFWIATFDDFIGESRNAHPPFYPLPALPRRKKGGSRSLSFPLKISWFFSAFGLLEVALQQALERLAVTGLVMILLIAMLKSRNISFQKVAI